MYKYEFAAMKLYLLKYFCLGILFFINTNTYADVFKNLKNNPANMFEIGMTRLQMQIDQVKKNNQVFLQYLNNIGFSENNSEQNISAYLSMDYPMKNGEGYNSNKILITTIIINDTQNKLSNQRATQLGEAYIKGAKSILGYIENSDGTITDITSGKIGSWFSYSNSSFEKRSETSKHVGNSLFFRVAIFNVINTKSLLCNSNGITSKISCRTLESYSKKNKN